MKKIIYLLYIEGKFFGQLLENLIIGNRNSICGRSLISDVKELSRNWWGNEKELSRNWAGTSEELKRRYARFWKGIIKELKRSWARFFSKKIFWSTFFLKKSCGYVWAPWDSGTVSRQNTVYSGTKIIICLFSDRAQHHLIFMLTIKTIKLQSI